MTALTSDLEEHFPHSKHHYDYVLAAEVLYHHDCFSKLLATMRHFCRPGTNLFWAIKVCNPSDLVFIEDFRKAFHTTMLAELDGVRIYSATHTALDIEDDLMKTSSTEDEREMCHAAWASTEEEKPARQKTQNNKDYTGDISKFEGQSDQAVMNDQKVGEVQEGNTGGNDTEHEISGKREKSEVHSESESYSTGNTEGIMSICYAAFGLFLLLLFFHLSQMTQVNSYLVGRFGNPSIPPSLAKRFTTFRVRKSS